MLKTPYYLIDIAKLKHNMAIISHLSTESGAKPLLALKCFSCWGVFDIMREYMAGTTSSSLYELRLGKETFGKETHAYSVAFSDDEIEDVKRYADKIIFNSISQLERFGDKFSCDKGLRVNPEISSSSFILADPARRHSRLGEIDNEKVAKFLPKIQGFMIHNNCENHDFEKFNRMLARIEEKYKDFLPKLRWISLGGGIHFTGKGYPIDKLAARLKDFSQKYDLTIYLEPGEAAITGCATLEISILDIVENEKKIAITDSSIECHMLDLLTYNQEAKIEPNRGPYEYIICGKSCLAGDIFGQFCFEQPLKIGDRLSVQDAAGYTMVKKNWFNGVNMPSIAFRYEDGTIKLQRSFDYEEYKASLS